eukprot:GHUV01041219.1.p1 GENE.GHUV01041219.1~~GHUV01041219.1.p1  ORF type:complete len:110 (+),score=15.52 GHUV01041219.1:71-400(+)
MHPCRLQALEDLYVHYDETVRNAAGGIVQFSYGDDGLDPVIMEGKDGKPIDFEKLLAKVTHTLSSCSSIRALPVDFMLCSRQTVPCGSVVDTCQGSCWILSLWRARTAD